MSDNYDYDEYDEYDDEDNANDSNTEAEDPISESSKKATRLYELFYGAVLFKAMEAGLDMPVCLEPDEVKKMNLENAFCLQDVVDSFQILLNFANEADITNSETDKSADLFFQNNKEQDNPAMALINEFLALIRSIKVAIKNKEYENEYNKILSANEEAIAVILAERSAIETVAAKIDEGGFPIDARKLARNYLHACKRNPQEAYQLLITNPAYFSPLILKGKKTLFRTLTGRGPKPPSPDVGKKINKELAKFLKNLKL